jgi:hypothetical protein
VVNEFGEQVMGTKWLAIEGLAYRAAFPSVKSKKLTPLSEKMNCTNHLFR